MKHFFESLNILSSKELDRMDDYVVKRTIQKGEHLIEVANVCDEIAYIKSGALLSYLLDKENKEIITCISFAGEFMSAFSSFIQATPSDEGIQAIVNTQLEVVKKADIDHLYATSNEWQKAGRIITEMQYLCQKQRITSFLKEDATSRYKSLEKKQHRVHTTNTSQLYCFLFRHIYQTPHSHSKISFIDICPTPC